jgi:hypothetical protein
MEFTISSLLQDELMRMNIEQLIWNARMSVGLKGLD